MIKRLRREMLEQPELVSMFMDEARLAARLNHPNIVRTYEVGADVDHFIAMEFLEGQPLNRLRHGRGEPLGPAAWARIIADALAGLHHAHELRDFGGQPLDVVHRDVSPHNIFVTYEGVVKLVDFGIAKAALNSVRTQAGAIKGKASYMAPEQVLGDADRRSDVFSMGIVLWEALAGRKLYTGEMVAVLHRVLHEPVPRLSSARPDVDPRLDAIVARALEKDPAARFQTAQEMRDALEGFLAQAGPPVRSEDVGRWLQAAFAEDRERTRRRLQAATEGRPFAEDVVDDLPALPTLPPPPRSSSPSLPPPPFEGASPLFEAASTSGSQLGVLVRTGSTRRARAPSGRALLGLGALAAVAAGVALAFVTARPGLDRSVVATRPPAAPAAASLEVQSTPPGARVTWNDKPLGETPLRLEMAPGPYTLLLSKDGYQTETLRVELRSAGAVARHAPLRPLAPEAPVPAPPGSAPTPGRLRPGQPAPGGHRRPPPAPPASAAAPPPPATAAAPPAPPPAASADRSKIQVVGDDAPKRIDVIQLGPRAAARLSARPRRACRRSARATRS